MQAEAKFLTQGLLGRTSPNLPAMPSVRQLLRGLPGSGVPVGDGGRPRSTMPRLEGSRSTWASFSSAAWSPSTSPCHPSRWASAMRAIQIVADQSAVAAGRIKSEEPTGDERPVGLDCLGRVDRFVSDRGVNALVTADHLGNVRGLSVVKASVTKIRLVSAVAECGRVRVAVRRARG